MLPAPEFADAELMALADTGIRARFSYGWSPLLAETEALPLADVERLHRDFAKFVNGGLIHLGLGWRGMWRFGKRSPETVYRREFEFARGIGIPIALHVPGVRNSPKVVEMHGKEGFLGKDVLIAHATWVTADEIRMLKDEESSVSLSPVTDARAGYGFPPTSELIDGGVNCCLCCAKLEPVPSLAGAPVADFPSRRQYLDAGQRVLESERIQDTGPI